MPAGVMFSRLWYLVMAAAAMLQTDFGQRSSMPWVFSHVPRMMVMFIMKKDRVLTPLGGISERSNGSMLFIAVIAFGP